MNWAHLRPGSDLVEFLESPADPEALSSILTDDHISPYLSSSSRSVLALEPVEDGVEMRIEDRMPAGKRPSINDFEQRLMLLLAKGFREVERSGSVHTDEFECLNCGRILPAHSVSCDKCGSRQLESAAVPASITYLRRIPVDGLNAEEALESIWTAVHEFEH